MRYKKYLLRAEQALMLALALTLCIGTAAQARQDSISSSVIRLHILAVSDDEYEQALKLRVRDAVIEHLGKTLSGAESAGEAEWLILGDLDAVARAAAEAAEGRCVTVSLGTEGYPTRKYDGFILPAGRYKSLRIVLGEGKGHNWWCIVFPQICLPAVEGEDMREALAKDDYAIIAEEEGYELRLRILELWGKLTQ